MKKCSVCGMELPDFVSVCGSCGGVPLDVVGAVGVADSNIVIAEQPIKKSFRIKWWTILVAALVLLGVLAGVGAVTNWFGLVAPTQKLGKAITKTVHADSFTIEYRFKDHASDETLTEKGTVEVVMNKDKKTIDYYFDGNGSMAILGGGTTLYIDGSEYVYQEPHDDYRGYATINESVNKDKAFFKVYNALLKDGKVNWPQVVKQTGLEEYINKSQIEAFVQEVAENCLKDKEWLEDNLGYQKEGNTYRFKVDIDELGESIKDLCNDSKAFKKDAKDAIEEYVDSFVQEAKKTDRRITAELTTEGGYLARVFVEIKDDEGELASFEISLRDVNKTVISSKTINKHKDNVRELLERNACAACGEKWGSYIGEEGYLCADCHRTCDHCGEVSEWMLNDFNEERWCDDCYNACSSCDSDAAAYDRDGERLCHACYYTCTSCGELEAYYERDGKAVCYDCRYVCEKCNEPCSDVYTMNAMQVCRACYVCDSCGASSPSYQLDGKNVCYSCYYTCASCGGGSASYERDGKRVCYDCRYVCEKCKKPCGYTYEYGGIDVCDACYVCESCGDNSPSYELNGKNVCYTCYFKCTSCGATSASYERGGKRVCYNCRYVCDKCDEPCSNTYEYGDLDVCEDCNVCSSCGDSYPDYERDGKPVCYDCRYKCEKCNKACGSTYTRNDQEVCENCYYTCDKCGEVASWSLNDVGDERWCDDCYVCSSCGESYPGYERDGKLVCYNCRYVCDNCGEACDDTNTYGDQEVCDDCYVCSSCGDSYPSYERDGKPVCYDCRYECEKCKKACGSTYTLNDQEVCETCYYTCDKCGEVDGWSLTTVGNQRWCDDCYVCSSCGDSYPDYERDGKLVCYNCRYVCDKCGEACSDTNTYGDQEVCDDCYVCSSCGDSYPSYERDGKPVCYYCYWEY